MQTFFGLRYLSRFLDWTQSRWPQLSLLWRSFFTFGRGCHEKHLLLAGVCTQYSGAGGFPWETLILWCQKVQALSSSKEDYQNQNHLHGENRRNSSWVVGFPPQVQDLVRFNKRIDSSWISGTCVGWRGCRDEQGSPHTALNSPPSGSLGFPKEKPVFSLIIDIKEDFGWPFSFEKAYGENI